MPQFTFATRVGGDDAPWVQSTERYDDTDKMLDAIQFWLRTCTDYGLPVTVETVTLEDEIVF